MNNEVLAVFEAMKKDKFTTNEEARNYIESIFKGYLKRKKNGTLYSRDDLIPQLLIGAYYTYVERLDINDVFADFKRRYIYTENQLEQVHELKERQGLSKVYDYLQEITNFSNVNVYEILKIHKILFSKVEFPEFGGSIRKIDVYLPGSGINLTSFEDIPKELQSLYTWSKELLQKGMEISTNPESTKIINYIDECIKLKCALIRIHPFLDGNGRSARALLNLYFKVANIPPVYVMKSERNEYQEAMNKAICDKEYNPDYTSINKFYYYKICDSLVTLDLDRQKQDNIIK